MGLAVIPAQAGIAGKSNTGAFQPPTTPACAGVTTSAAGRRIMFTKAVIPAQAGIAGGSNIGASPSPG